MSEIDPDIIQEVYRILHAEKREEITEGQTVPTPGRDLTPIEVYDHLITLLPLAEQKARKIRRLPGFMAAREIDEHRAALAAAQTQETDRIRPLFRHAGELFCMTDDLDAYNKLAIARFALDSNGRPISIVEEMYIYGGIDSSEDPMAQLPQRLSYVGPNLYLPSQVNGKRYPVSNTDKVPGMIQRFLERF